MDTETTKAGKHDLFTRWMNDAYRMELTMMPVLEHHINDAEGHDKLQAKLQEHLHATQHHADLVRSCLERIGEAGPSDDAANSRANAPTVTNGAAGDLLIKDGLNDYSSEQYEIATYKALITAARDLGQMDCERSFEEILNEEQEMAEWLDVNLPLLVEQTIRHAA
jgi:ferritin-like metal-binding protein YciE